eukprot:gene29254-36271_t
MIRQLNQSRVLSRSFSKLKPLVATEEFPLDVKFTPSKASASVVKESKLSSGIKLITKESNASVVNIKLAVLGGSRAETADQKGAAHFLAAAAYSGNNNNSGLRIVRYFESLGAVAKSSVDREKIVFDVTVLADKVDAAFAGLATAISTPPHAHYVFDEDVKSIANIQYHIAHGNHKAQVNELLHEAAFGEDSPLGGSIYPQNVDRLEHDQIIAYRNKHFVADNLVVAASGISHEKLQALVEQYVVGGKVGNAAAQSIIALEVGQIRTATTPSASLSAASPYAGGEVKLRQEVGGESHVGLAFPVPAGEAGKPFAVLSGLLAEKFGADNVFLNSYSSGGLSGVYASGEGAAAGAKLQAVIGEIKNIAAGGVKDVSAVKTKLTLAHFLAFEGSNTTDVFLNAIANGVAPHTVGDVRNVTAEQVAAAAKAALKSTPSYAVYGTTANTPSFSSINALWK